jgi:hypothetical protein
MSHTTTCPRCHFRSEVDESLIGRFLDCEHCRCLYYVVVPPLGAEHGEWSSVAATGHVDATPQAGRSLTQTESLLRKVQQLIIVTLLNSLISLLVLGLALYQLLK